MNNTILEKTLVRWINFKLRDQNITIDNICEGIKNGVIPIKLLNLAGHGLEFAELPIINIFKCLDCLHGYNFALDIKAQDIIDPKQESVVNFVWYIALVDICKNILTEYKPDTELKAKCSMLKWIKEKTVGYEGVFVRSFHGSLWKSGLAFSAIIHFFNPIMFNYKTLMINRTNIQVLSHAFTTATDLGIEQLLDVDDVQIINDERCIFLYVCLYYHKFLLESSAIMIDKEGNYLKIFGHYFYQYSLYYKKVSKISSEFQLLKNSHNSQVNLNNFTLDQCMDIRRKQDTVDFMLSIPKELIRQFPEAATVLIEPNLESFNVLNSAINNALEIRLVILFKNKVTGIINQFHDFKEGMMNLSKKIKTMNMEGIMYKHNTFKYKTTEMSYRYNDFMCTLNEHSIYYNMLILKIQQNVALLQALNKEIKQLYVSWSHEVHIYLETLFEEEATEMSESLDNNMCTDNVIEFDLYQIIRGRLDAFTAKKQLLIENDLFSDKLDEIYRNVEKLVQEFLEKDENVLGTGNNDSAESLTDENVGSLENQ